MIIAASWNTSSRLVCTPVTPLAASLRRPSAESSLATIREWTPKVAKRLGVVGLINIQYAVIPDGTVYIIEANPARPTVPFVAKAIGHPLAKYASS